MAFACNWCFTVNNFTENDIELIKNWKFNYLIFGKEKGENGTPHLQGYLQTVGRFRISGMKKFHQTAHWEPAKGSCADNQKYCSKEGDVTELGNPVIKGKKKCDIVDCVKMTLNKDYTQSIVDKHGAGYVCNKRKIDDVVQTIERENMYKKIKLDYEG